MLICRELPIDEKCIEHVQDGPTFEKLVDNDEATIDDASDEDEDEDVDDADIMLMLVDGAADVMNENVDDDGEAAQMPKGVLSFTRYMFCYCCTGYNALSKCDGFPYQWFIYLLSLLLLLGWPPQLLFSISFLQDP